MSQPHPSQPANTPWWRYPMVWLVILGPAAVVVASLATAVIAIRTADPVVSVEREGGVAHQPAVQGRNQAAADASRQPAD